MFDFLLTKENMFDTIHLERMFANVFSLDFKMGDKIMKAQKNIYEMTDRELRAYKRRLHRQRAIRRRCMMVLMTVCLVMVCAVSYHSIKSNAHTSDQEMNFKYYASITVACGDTLWELADEYIDYEQYADKEVYLAEVRNINHLDESMNIKTGQNLILPYYSNDFVK